MNDETKDSWTHAEVTGDIERASYPIDNEGFDMMSVEGVMLRIHEHVAYEFMDWNRSGKTKVIHIDGNKRNNTLVNLAIVSTHVEYVFDDNKVAITRIK